jgi:hypothetical protein
VSQTKKSEFTVSVDGRRWTVIDRKRNTDEFKKTGTTSYAVGVQTNPADFRFVRLTQTARNQYENDFLILYGVEFFGTLSE